jgi:hypothetical protein
MIMTLNTYIVRQAQIIYSYATVEASSKAEALRLVDDGSVNFGPSGTHGEAATFKVTDMWASDRERRTHGARS